MISTHRFTPIPGINHRASRLSVREILFIQDLIVLHSKIMIAVNRCIVNDKSVNYQFILTIVLFYIETIRLKRKYFFAFYTSVNILLTSLLAGHGILFQLSFHLLGKVFHRISPNLSGGA